VIKMARLCTEFDIKVMVPDWKYCNTHRKDEPNSIKNDHCDFISKYDRDYYCRLFGGVGLYSNGYRVLKCDKCLSYCKVDGDNG
jgi:hypothetical protein